MAKRTSWIVGLSLAGLALGPDLYQLLRLSLIQHRLDGQLSQLAKQREQLEREQERLKSDPIYVEGLIRSTFKVAKPGEYVIPLDATIQAHPAKENAAHR